MTTRDGVEAALAELVSRFPAAWLTNPDDVGAALRDRCPDAQSREIAVLIEAVRYDVPRKLLAARGGPLGIVVPGIAQRWTASSGIESPLATWGVEAWASALGLDFKRTAPHSNGEGTLEGPGAGKTIGGTGTREKEKKSGLSRPVVIVLGIAGAAILLVVAFVGYGIYLDSGKSADVAAGDTARAASLWQLAHDDYQRALDIDDTLTHAWYGDGMALLGLKRFDDAVQSFGHAIALDAKMEVSYMERGYAYSVVHQDAQALADDKKAVALDANDKYAVGNLAIEQYVLHHDGDALATSLRATSLGASTNGGTAITCLASYRLGRTLPVRACSDAVATIKDEAPLWTAYGWSLLAADRTTAPCNAAQQAFVSAEKIDSSMSEATRGFTTCLLRERRYGEALAQLRVAIRRFPQSAVLWNDLGVAYADTGDRASAIRSYQTALRIDPALSVASKNLRILEAR